ncbi:uncharacterized protein LOC112049861 [Bicyclus anynana]|uniref:Uncharacterized protein LOC112049861 n=1 Tax=Bicyclus anynana TaxID=110368 RepID=A0ABM3LR97_BICAN|nr:uncharacterized protein LOC112049861 [Bicyclus anynana]
MQFDNDSEEKRGCRPPPARRPAAAPPPVAADLPWYLRRQLVADVATTKREGQASTSPGRRARAGRGRDDPSFGAKAEYLARRPFAEIFAYYVSKYANEARHWTFEKVKVAERFCRRRRSPPLAAMRPAAALVLCLAVALGSAARPRARPAARPAARRAAGSSVAPHPFASLALPVLPVLLLPLQVAAPAAPPTGTECDARAPQRDEDDYEDVDDVPRQKPRRPPAAAADPPAYPAYVDADRLDETATGPPVAPSASSKELLEQFRAQAPAAPHLPPALLSAHDASERAAPADAPDEPEPAPAAAGPAQGYLPALGASARAPAPPRPRLRSLELRGALTVPHADYTEPYTAWWDAESGAARVDFHGGATSTVRAPQPDGSVQRLEVRVDRSGDGVVRRCGRADGPADAADRAPPALPDLEPFAFAGYTDADGQRAERWTHTLSGRVGELGAARGEALTFRHELLLRREPGDLALPLRYTVRVDSSLLGADCDGYAHEYESARALRPDPALFAPDAAALCDSLERLNASAAEHRARLEPLREFTLPHRDPRYDAVVERFKAEFGRRYADDAEEALRRNLLVQNVRFTSAGNRQGATHRLELNFLGDRLAAELDELLGVRAEPERERAESFPLARGPLRAAERELPERFDWRARGAVSPVRYQGSCASCWAFAVAGAVEGALFVRTRRLVPLAEKCLVDCARPFGGNGCRGTWPSHAYDYVRSRGLPARDDYPPYDERAGRCAERDARAVTRISAHVNVTALSVPALQVAIKEHAPSVVIIDAKAKSFVFYKKGVLYDDRCGKAGARLNHAVLAVGWGARRGEPHFVLKNSWSDAWGERGYVRVQARANTCGVLAKPSYPRLERADVLRT